MPKVKHSQERLEIMDYLLSSKKSIKDREKFCDLINSKLPHDNPVTISSIDKDIKALKEEVSVDDVEILYSKSQGYYYSEEGYSRYRQTLNDDDKILLVIAENLFQTFKNTHLKNKFKALVDKVVKRGGPSRFWEDISGLNFIQLEGGAGSPGSKHLPDLIQYIYEQKSIKVKYGPDGNVKNLSPYVLKQNKGRWYLVAYDHDKTGIDKIKIYLLDRIAELNDGIKAYYKDPVFNPEDYFKYTIGIWHRYDAKPVKVELELRDPRLIESIIEVPIHQTQKIKSRRQNSLKLQIEVYDTVELEQLILGYGTKVKVVGPDSLRVKISQIS